MKIKLDHNLSRHLQATLEVLGHDVDTAFDEGLARATDKECTVNELPLLNGPEFESSNNALPPDIHRRPQTTGRHRPGHPGLRAAQEEGRELDGVLPVS